MAHTFAHISSEFDVVIAQGPGAFPWPTVGARALSSLCSELGLKVASIGGADFQIVGLFPLEGTGAILLAQDIQGRIHELRTRALVRVLAPSTLPPAFPGWNSPGLLPLATARRLQASQSLRYDSGVIILGTGNKALRFGSDLLENAHCAPGQVLAVEWGGSWGTKRFAGWEVEKRRFEMCGGRWIEAEPLELRTTAVLRYELRLRDSQGVRIEPCSVVVGAGPYFKSYPVREYPAGSLLFEFEQSAQETPEADIEGWNLEDERARFLAGRLIRALVADLGPRKQDLDQVLNQSRLKLKRMVQHREAPFEPQYQGKWIAAPDTKKMREFSGAPQKLHRIREVATIECFEEIGCDLCARACPYDAIEIGKIPRPAHEPILSEDRCIACGICVAACPSRAIAMVHTPDSASSSRIVIAAPRPSTRSSALQWEAGEYVQLLNRRGESLGSGRIHEVQRIEGWSAVELLRLEVPSHLAFEARSVRKQAKEAVVDPAFESGVFEQGIQNKVAITFEGEKRWVRPGIPITQALFEVGRARPEDVLFCEQSECNRCTLSVDGVRKLACETLVHEGMAVRFLDSPSQRAPNDSFLCVCESVSTQAVQNCLKESGLSTLEAIASATRVGAGRCHGLLCMGTFRKVISELGGRNPSEMDPTRWIDWRFPWRDWVVDR